MGFFVDITFAEVCLALITLGLVDQALARFAPLAVLRALGLMPQR